MKDLQNVRILNFDLRESIKADRELINDLYNHISAINRIIENLQLSLISIDASRHLYRTGSSNFKYFLNKLDFSFCEIPSQAKKKLFNLLYVKLLAAYGLTKYFENTTRITSAILDYMCSNWVIFFILFFILDYQIMKSWTVFLYLSLLQVYLVSVKNFYQKTFAGCQRISNTGQPQIQFMPFIRCSWITSNVYDG